MASRDLDVPGPGAPTGRQPSSALRRRCDPATIPFDTTADAAPVEGIVGQQRASDAVRFGMAMRQQGYNLFAVGPPGIGKQTLLHQFLDRQAEAAPAPSDWVYVHGFADPHRPQAIRLAAGRGARLRDDMDRAVHDLQAGLRAAFESEEYRTRKHQLATRLKDRRERAIEDIHERGRRKDIAVIVTDSGFGIAPLRAGKIIEPEDFQRLPDPEKAALQANLEGFGEELHSLLHQLHELGHTHEQEIHALDREIAAGATRRVLDLLRAAHGDNPALVDYLSRVEQDVIDHHDDFLDSGAEGLEAALRRTFHGDRADGPAFRRYRVNPMTDASVATGAPVIYVDNPTFTNLVGRIEHTSQLGALVTDFTLIKPGALHRANGGYLLVDALELLRQPYAWDALKRAIRTREIRMESLGQLLGLVPTVSLEPEPIPLESFKVVLLGDRSLYYLLARLDPEFPELFKVLADFDDAMDRGPESQVVYANLVATLARSQALRPFDRGAVAGVIDQAARLAGDADKLSLHMRQVVDLLREADQWAEQAGRAVVSRADVQAAIDAQRDRAGRLRERLLEAMQKRALLIDTSGERIGQVNGLAVVPLGEQDFGYPVRITARVRVGSGQVTDVEREAELGGPIHAKGVLILSGLLGTRYAPRTPLSLAASLVFEQSYGPVEGDSASLAEACALLSALAEAPVNQALAVTGSINQHGQVQAIGGVNEKIEGFFDLCRARGLDGGHGVIIPAANVHNLMLRQEVVDAVEAGRFAIHAVADVDHAIELLSGRPAGRRDASGQFAAGTVNGAVEERLLEFAESARLYAAGE